jgi:hypothetical protein
MTIKANLADGTVLNFPDGTDQAVIDGVVKKHISKGQAEIQPLEGNGINQDRKE